jgi:hypothetical protein
MSVERVTVPAVRFVDETGRSRTMVPLLDEDGAWFVLDEAGVSYYSDAQQVRDFAQILRDDVAADPDLAMGETIAAYEALADLIGGTS